MNRIFEKRVENLDIYIAEKHHHVILPWAKVKRKNGGEDLLLISFDHHTDTHEPFLTYCQNDEEKMKQLIARINYDDDTSVNSAIVNLKHDEHIKTAIQSCIISKAFIISHSNTFDDIPESIEEEERLKKVKNWDKEYIEAIVSGNSGITPREKRHYRESDIYMPPFLPEGMYEYSGEYDDVVLDDSFLEEKIATLNRMCPNIMDKNGQVKCKYILDIDLDYFHTMKSINPKSIEIFSKLVKGAEAITIAKEADCVELERTDERVTSEILLERLLVLLEKIVNNNATD